MNNQVPYIFPNMPGFPNSPNQNMPGFPNNPNNMQNAIRNLENRVTRLEREVRRINNRLNQFDRPATYSNDMPQYQTDSYNMM